MMILIRRHPRAAAEQIDLAEFERRAKSGELGPQHEACFAFDDVLSFTAPNRPYREVFAAIRAGSTLAEPYRLLSARRRLVPASTP